MSSYDDYDTYEDKLQDLRDIGVDTDNWPQVQVENVHRIITLIHEDIGPELRKVFRRIVQNITLSEIEHRDRRIASKRHNKLDEEMNDIQELLEWADAHLDEKDIYS